MAQTFSLGDWRVGALECHDLDMNIYIIAFCVCIGIETWGCTWQLGWLMAFKLLSASMLLLPSPQLSSSIICLHFINFFIRNIHTIRCLHCLFWCFFVYIIERTLMQQHTFHSNSFLFYSDPPTTMTTEQNAYMYSKNRDTCIDCKKWHEFIRQQKKSKSMRPHEFQISIKNDALHRLVRQVNTLNVSLRRHSDKWRFVAW